MAAIRDVTGSKVQRLHPLGGDGGVVSPVVIGKEGKLHLPPTPDQPHEIPIPDEPMEGDEDDLDFAEAVDLPTDLKNISRSDRNFMEQMKLKRRAQALDDVPFGIKRTRYQDEPLEWNSCR